VTALCHDRDGSSMNVVHEFWPAAVEYNDAGHAANNFRKSISDLAKIFPKSKTWAPLVSDHFDTV